MCGYAGNSLDTIWLLLQLLREQFLMFMFIFLNGSKWMILSLFYLSKHSIVFYDTECSNNSLSKHYKNPESIIGLEFRNFS